MPGCSAGSTSGECSNYFKRGPAISTAPRATASFELHGLDPDSEIPVSFLEPKRKLGATVRFSGKSAGGEPIVVKLEPCATATARLVGPDGKPLGGFTQPALISMVVTPGEFFAIKARKEGTLLADQDFLTDIDPINYQKDPASDAQGRIVFPALIPARPIGSSTAPQSAPRTALSSARNSPSSLARPSTWAIS